MKLVIKNMVCPRCVEAVRSVFDQLGLPIADIELGQVHLASPPTEEQELLLRSNLRARGFELLDDRQTQLINTIKSLIIDQIHYQDEPSPHNFSTLLAEQLHYDYAYLSRLFSAVEGRTIEKFILAQKVEKVKELLTYDELTLSEIAFQMNYSSSAHLSAQFRKLTGMSPSNFRDLQQQGRKFLDDV